MFAFFVIPVILSLLFTVQHRTLPPSHVPPQDQKVLLVTAHPDDECMFFAPSILALREQHIDVYGLVLSNGNADGIGHVRQTEVTESFEVLGVHNDRVFILDHPQLQDNFTQSWPAELVGGIIHDYVVRLGITDILTFDRQGVSNHPNHISVCEAAILFLAKFKALPGLTDTENVQPRLFVLDSVRLTRKYMGIMAPIATNIILAFESFVRNLFTAFSKPLPPNNKVVFVLSPAQYVKAFRAMEKHWSQLVWFRWLYILFSRYMWVNDLVQVGEFLHHTPEQAV